jgi:hypothetical protein
VGSAIGGATAAASVEWTFAAAIVLTVIAAALTFVAIPAEHAGAEPALGA